MKTKLYTSDIPVIFLLFCCFRVRVSRWKTSTRNDWTPDRNQFEKLFLTRVFVHQEAPINITDIIQALCFFKSWLILQRILEDDSSTTNYINGHSCPCCVLQPHSSNGEEQVCAPLHPYSLRCVHPYTPTLCGVCTPTLCCVCTPTLCGVCTPTLWDVCTPTLCGRGSCPTFLLTHSGGDGL